MQWRKRSARTGSFSLPCGPKSRFCTRPRRGNYRYHDLFRDFLEAELRRSGEREWLAALRDGAALLYERGDAAGALVLYTKARAASDIARIVERNGFSLFERGEAQNLSQALDVLPDELRRSNALVSGLRATIDASFGRFEIAEPSFLAAIAGAKDEPDLRLRLVHRYALELVRLGRDCVAFLEPYASDDALEARYRAPLLATLATGYLRVGRTGDALRAVDAALKLTDGSVADESRARLYQQAAYVERYAGSLEKARAYAESAIQYALANNLFELAARAYSVLYTIVYDTTDDPIQSLKILDRLNECALKGASLHALLFGLVAKYEIEVERGSDEALERLDEALHERPGMLPRLRATTLVAMDALRAAWAADFAAAYATIAETAPEQSTIEQRTLREADAALYATAAGLQSEQDAHFQQALQGLEACSPSNKHVVRARLTLALTALLRGHDAAAHRLLADAERSLSTGRMRAFAHAVRAIYRIRLGQAEEAEFAAALERLRGEHFGGIARMLQALPIGTAQSAYTTLTAAEREVLQLLAKGASTKEIANRTARSPHTVDTHIRSICRKSSCSGRREAVALASSRGWVEA